MPIHLLNNNTSFSFFSLLQINRSDISKLEQLYDRTFSGSGGRSGGGRGWSKPPDPPQPTGLNWKQNQNQSQLGRTHFPALYDGYIHFLQILICSLRCLRLLSLARVITVDLVLQHSIENHSNVTVIHFM